MCNIRPRFGEKSTGTERASFFGSRILQVPLDPLAVESVARAGVSPEKRRNPHSISQKFEVQGAGQISIRSQICAVLRHRSTLLFSGSA